MDILTMKSKVSLGCNRCDKCCVYRGDIKLTGVNIYQISKHLNMTPKEFIEKYTERLEDSFPEIVFKTKGEKRECILYDDDFKGCSINSIKPLQCIMFPLVPENLKRNYFTSNNQCPYVPPKKITVKKWLDGNNRLYSKNKKNYLKWISYMEWISYREDKLTKEEKEKIYFYLFENYDIKKNNLNKQFDLNLKEVERIINQKED